jgi:hypothetical protein
MAQRQVFFQDRAKVPDYGLVGRVRLFGTIEHE